MKKVSLEFGWTIVLPDVLSVLSNRDGYVSITCYSKQFGDVQSLHLKICEKSVDVIFLPHYLDGVTVSTDKEITISFNIQIEDFIK